MSERNEGRVTFGKVAFGVGVIAALGYGGYKGVTVIQQDSYEQGLVDGQRETEDVLYVNGRLLPEYSCFRFGIRNNNSTMYHFVMGLNPPVSQVITCGDLELLVTNKRDFSALPEGGYKITVGFKVEQSGRKTSEGVVVYNMD